MLATHMKLNGDLAGDLSRFEAKIKEQVLRAGAGAMAAFIQTEAKAALVQAEAVRTGLLRDAIFQFYAADHSTAERQVYLVSWNKRTAPHGHLIEFGTSKMAARPFMRPAFDRIDDAIKAGQERMADKLKEIT